MKKLLFAAAVALVITGCDDKQEVSEPKNLTISEMVAQGKESYATECKTGDASTNCEFLSGDLLGTGKFHHSKIYLYKNGEAELSVDGESFYQSDVSTSNYGGETVTTYEMKNLNEMKAEIRISISNNQKSLAFEAFNSDGKKFVMGSIQI